MKLSGEITIDPGPNAFFVAEVGVSRGVEIYDRTPWWSVSIGWWLFKPVLWKDWLWDYRNEDDSGWKVWQIMIFGFDILWERFDGRRNT